jgi:hypothetical protein
VLGSLCTSTIPTTTVTATLKYEALGPNAEYSDWATTPTTYPAMGVLVLSKGANEVVDAAYTSVTGQFTIKVPQTPTVTDGLFFVAAGDNGLGGLAFAVADPSFSTQGMETPGINVPSSPRLWNWSIADSGVTPGGDLTIRIANGSGALRVHQNLLYAYLRTYSKYGSVGDPLIVWLGFGTTWTCGKCFAPLPYAFSGQQFLGQVFLAGDSSNQPYWADAVTEHELGHWVMASYGTSPGEGGAHYMGTPTFPGMAWSEGWATWFSSDARGSPIYYDKQNGGMFWVNLSTAQGREGPIALPSAADPSGVLQMLDENEVAAMLRTISTSSASASDAVFAALISTRMNTAPWGRGYTRHMWNMSGPTTFTNVVDTHESSPCFADMLDAIDCAGLPSDSIDAATQPATYYPYNSAAPICH